MMKYTPDFIVIGAEKSGTTWLYNQLSRHPDIGLPPTKELHFFNSCNSYGKVLKNYEKGMDWYKRHFNSLKEPVLGEITPLYLSDSLAVKRIQRDLVDTKFIVVLRNPVDRAVSQYNMATNKGHKTLNLLREIELESLLIQRGLYSQQLKEWFCSFDKRDFLILKYEDLFTQNSAERICDFLGVRFAEDVFRFEEKVYSNPIHRLPWLFHRLGEIAKFMHNSDLLYKMWCGLKRLGLVRIVKGKFIYSGLSRNPVDDMIIHSLREYYAEDISNLEKMLNWDLSEWKKR